MTDSSMSCREAGRIGGRARRAQNPDYAALGTVGGAVTKARYGIEHYRTIGKRGGRTTADERGSEHFRAMGRKGGSRTAELIKKGKASE